MSEPRAVKSTHIPQQLMLQRLAQSEQMREFFVQMWLQNPALARHVDDKVKALLLPLNRTVRDTVSP